jgi:hypothetical protein
MALSEIFGLFGERLQVGAFGLGPGFQGEDIPQRRASMLPFPRKGAKRNLNRNKWKAEFGEGLWISCRRNRETGNCLYLDASAVAATMVDEGASARVARFIREAGEPLIVTDLTAAEVASALSRLLGTRREGL